MEVKTSGFSIAGFVLSIVSLVIALVPICCGGILGEILALILGIIGLIMSIIGKSNMKNTYGQVSTIGKVGFVISIIDIPLSIIGLIVMIVIGIFTGGVGLFI